MHCYYYLDRFSRFSIADGRESLYNALFFSLSKLPLRVAIWTPIIHGSSRPPEPTFQTVSRSVQLFAQGSRSLQTDRLTDRPRYSVCSNRPHLASAAMQPQNDAFIISWLRGASPPKIKRHRSIVPAIMLESFSPKALERDGRSVYLR